jgi:hypothetical protein
VADVKSYRATSHRTDVTWKGELEVEAIAIGSSSLKAAIVANASTASTAAAAVSSGGVAAPVSFTHIQQQPQQHSAHHSSSLSATANTANSASPSAAAAVANAAFLEVLACAKAGNALLSQSCLHVNCLAVL